jgi:hypothetical protein
MRERWREPAAGAVAGPGGAAGAAATLAATQETGQGPAARPRVLALACEMDGDLLGEEVVQLRGNVLHFEGELVKPVSQNVEHAGRRDGNEESKGGRYQRFGNAGRDRGRARDAALGNACKGMDDADHGAEEADEWSGRSDRCQPPDAPAELGRDGQDRALDRSSRGLDSGASSGPSGVRTGLGDERGTALLSSSSAAGRAARERWRLVAGYARLPAPTNVAAAR